MPSPVLTHLRSTAFERLHLRRNPFGELSREERAATAQVEIEDLATFLRGRTKGERRALQLVADHGRGKSTHLIALHARAFPDAPFHQLHARASLPALAASAPLQFVDSIENLGWLGRKRLFARCQNLACTTHRDLSRELRRAGFEVHTRSVGIASVDELLGILQSRIDAASLPTGQAPPLRSSQILQLHARFGDDVRSIEHALYLEYERFRIQETS